MSNQQQQQQPDAAPSPPPSSAHEASQHTICWWGMAVFSAGLFTCLAIFASNESNDYEALNDRLRSSKCTVANYTTGTNVCTRPRTNDVYDCVESLVLWRAVPDDGGPGAVHTTVFCTRSALDVSHPCPTADEDRPLGFVVDCWIDPSQKPASDSDYVRFETFADEAKRYKALMAVAIFVDLLFFGLFCSLGFGQSSRSPRPVPQPSSSV
jgi:hypothetical protein